MVVDGGDCISERTLLQSSVAPCGFVPDERSSETKVVLGEAGFGTSPLLEDDMDGLEAGRTKDFEAVGARLDALVTAPLLEDSLLDVGLASDVGLIDDVGTRDFLVEGAAAKK